MEVVHTAWTLQPAAPCFRPEMGLSQPRSHQAPGTSTDRLSCLSTLTAIGPAIPCFLSSSGAKPRSTPRCLGAQLAAEPCCETSELRMGVKVVNSRFEI